MIGSDYDRQRGHTEGDLRVEPQVRVNARATVYHHVPPGEERSRVLQRLGLERYDGKVL